MDVWLCPLNSAELLALVHYGKHLSEQLPGMRDARCLSGVVELGEQWNPLRQALVDDADHHVAPGIPNAVRLRDRVWVVLARQVTLATPRKACVPLELEELRDAVADLYDGISRREHHLLVCGVPDASLPMRLVSAPNHQPISVEVARLRRHLSLRAENTLREQLNRADSGLQSEDPAERWRAFIEVGEVFANDGKGVHPAVLEELKTLFIPLLSGHASRHQAALLLGLVAESMGDDEHAAPEEITLKLSRNLGIIGTSWENGDWPGVLEEALPSARICLAICAIRVGFAGSEALDPLVADAQPIVRRAIDGEQDAFRQATELALDLARAGR